MSDIREASKEGSSASVAEPVSPSDSRAGSKKGSKKGSKEKRRSKEDGPRCMEVVFEINAPAEGEEEDPFFDVPEGANRSRIDFLKEELAKPHSNLRLRIKDRLEKVIALDTVKAYDVAQDQLPPERKKYNTDFSVHGELALRNPPKATGNAYMMPAFTPQTAPFMGINYVPFTKDVEVHKDVLPTFYQPFRPDHEHPFGRHPPSSKRPCGELQQPVESSDRVFTTGRLAPTGTS